MRRRDMLRSAMGVGAVGIAKPALAQPMPELQWRLSSSFPPTVDVIYGTAEVFANAVAEATDNRFRIRVLPPGEVVQPLQSVDAVGNDTVEICHTAAYYFVG